MKKFLLSIFCCLMAVFAVQAESVTLNYSDVIGQGTSGGGGGFECTVSPIKFSFSDAYGNTSHIKAYGACEIALSGATITKVVINATAASYIKTWKATDGDISVSGTTATWTGSASELVLSNTDTAQARITSIVVTYTTSGDTTNPVDVAEPTFTPADGATFDESLAVTITAEEGLDVYYSTDNKVSYTEGNTVNVTETTTVYAYAEDADGNKSDVVSATYTKKTYVAGNWKLVTNVANLSAGDEVVIVAADYDFALSTTQNSNNRGQAEVQKNDNAIKFTNDVQVITLEDGKVDETFAFNVGDGYLYAASSSSNYLKTEKTLSNNSSWSIAIANNNVATIVAKGTYTRNTMQYNQSSALFSCYGSASQKAVSLYKNIKEGEDPVVTPVAPILPAETTFTGSMSVEITGIAADATVYYTTDESDPATSATRVEYTEPFEITATTTVKAVAVNEVGASDVVSVTYTKVESMTIAEAKSAYDEAGANAEVYINLEGCVVTVNSDKYLYIQDSESGINVYNSGATYPAGTKFTAGTLSGISTAYNGMHQISTASFSDVTTEAETVAVTPIDVTVAQLNNAYATYEGRYVKLSGVALESTTITQGNDTYTLFNRFAIAVEDAATCDIIGIPACYGTTLQIFPTEIILPLVAELPSVSVADGSEIEQGSKIVITPAAENVVTYSVNGTAAVAIDGETVISAENVGTMTLVVTSAYGGNTLTATYTYTVKAAIAKVITALTSEEIKALGKNSARYEDIEVPSASGVWTGLSFVNKNGYLQLRSADGEYIQSPEFLGDVKSITLVINNTNKREFTFTSGEVELGTLANEGVAGEEITLNIETAGVKSFKVVANGTTQISDIKVVYEQPAPFELNVGSTGYATLYLGCDATIPAGVECYTIASVENGYVSLAKIDDTFVPAYTAIIVKAEADASYTFNYGNTHTATVAGNFLKGTVATTDITPVENTVYYVLASVDGVVGLYKDELSGGIFRNNANKAYLPVVVESGNGIASYSFNFDWAGTTGIEGVAAEGAQDGAIYDITGRRVKAITAPGIYIVNGRKVVK